MESFFQAMTDQLHFGNLLSSPASKAKHTIGICAMDVKTRSRPMRNILAHLLQDGDLEAVIFGDKLILDEDIHTWPVCDFLITFYSHGFPLEKAIEYVKLRSPYCLNDLWLQKVLLDRRAVLKVLDAIGANTPRRLVAFPDHGPQLSDELVERLQRLTPNVDASWLTRKHDYSIVQQPNEDTIRIDGESMTKPFVEKPARGENHNIWIYYKGGGVRKLFRKVGDKSSEFVPDIWEIRRDGSYIYEEYMETTQDIKVYTVGTQFFYAESRKSPTVDGIVHRNKEGKEVRHVTPLNESESYIASRVGAALGQTVCGFDLIRANQTSYVIDVNGWSFVKGNQDYHKKCASVIRELFMNMWREQSKLNSLCNPHSFESHLWRLKGFISVIRHGDRTPKLKLKFTFATDGFKELLNGSEEEVTLRSREALKLVKDATKSAIANKEGDMAKLIQLRDILDMKSDLPGTKIQVKPGYRKESDNTRVLEKVTLLVKWGGEFTHAGHYHSKDLGETLRKELSIFNPSLLKNVKFYTASERRVVQTAEVFVPYLQPQSEIVVRKDMLDDSFMAKEQIEHSRRSLRSLINDDIIEGDIPQSFQDALSHHGIKREDLKAKLRRVIEILQVLRKLLDENSEDMNRYGELCTFETWDLFKERWVKLVDGFTSSSSGAMASLNPSRISELYDTIKYDVLHHYNFCTKAAFKQQVALFEELYRTSRLLFDVVAPLEYGLTASDQRDISLRTNLPLLQQLLSDLTRLQDDSTMFTRLYFTKESHVHTLLNLLFLVGGDSFKMKRYQVEELDYLTQICFEVMEGEADHSQLVRLTFSPGVYSSNLLNTEMDENHSISVSPRRDLSVHMSLQEWIATLTGLVEKGKEQVHRCDTPR